WSLGMLLYVCAEGVSPLRRATTLATLAAVLDDPVPPPVRSGPLAQVLQSLLVRDPAARPDAARLDELLARAESGDTPEWDRPTMTAVSAPPTPTPPASIPAVPTPTASTPTVTAPAAPAPTVTTPAALTPAASTPAAPTLPASAPAAPAPTVPAPAVPAPAVLVLPAPAPLPGHPPRYRGAALAAALSLTVIATAALGLTLFPFGDDKSADRAGGSTPNASAVPGSTFQSLSPQENASLLTAPNEPADSDPELSGSSPSEPGDSDTADSDTGLPEASPNDSMESDPTDSDTDLSESSPNEPGDSDTADSDTGLSDFATTEPAAPTPTPTPTRSKSSTAPAKTTRWIVQLSSVKLSAGTAERDRSLKKIQATVPEARVLRSNDYQELAPGYWVVYAPGPFADASAGDTFCAEHHRSRSDCLPRRITPR
ncbi:hypothetical protein ABZ871_04910, partial [Streptomyces populi]